MSQSLPLVSVVVPVFGDKEMLRRCLRALEGQDYAGRREIIIVNNGRPGDLRDLGEEFPDVAFVDEPTPGSYHARNAGVAKARGEVLAFTDADCVPDPSWIAHGMCSLLGNERCGLVGGRVEVIPRDPGRSSIAELHDLVFGFRQKHYVERRRFAATANMLTKRDVMERVGPFRGALRSGGDAEWGQRVARAGYTLVYDHAAVVGHPARDYHEVIRKMRRTAAGERDRHPDWRSCLRWSLERMGPLPLGTVRNILQGKEVAMSARQKVLLLAFATVLRWQTAIERLRLQVSGDASPR